MSDDSKIVKCTGVVNSGTVSILVRGSNKLIVDEADRSLHDALCVVRSIIKSKGLVCGGGYIFIIFSFLNNFLKVLLKLKWLYNLVNGLDP